MNIQELRETVNPVFNTAKSCLYMNAAAGDVDSKHLMEVIGFAPAREENTNKNIPPEMLETVNRLIPVFMTYTESRFQSMNRLVMSMPERTVVDLPCGYTARGLKLSRQGRSLLQYP